MWWELSTAQTPQLIPGPGSASWRCVRPAGGWLKRWPEISLRLHLVLDSEKEVDLPTDPSPQWMGDRLFNRRTRSDKISPCTQKVVLLESPSQPQIYQRPDPHRSEFDHYLFKPITYLPDSPTYQSSSASVLASESERELTRDQSSRASQRSVSPSCSHPSYSPFSLRSLYLLFLPLSAKVTKIQPPWQAHVHGERKCTGLI